MTMRNALWVGLTFVMWLADVGYAATIVVGDHAVTPNDKTFVPIMIQREDGDPNLLGVELAIQTGDGLLGPTIGTVDLVTGTIFADNHTGSRDKGSLPRQAFWETTTAAGAIAIPPAGLLARIEIDASGLTSGTYDLTLTTVLGQSTVLFDEMANVVVPNNGEPIKGSITIVPEPSGGLACAGLVLIAWCRRRFTHPQSGQFGNAFPP